MTNLIRTEWLKMRKYNAFWWIMGLTALSYPGITYISYYAFNEEVAKSDDQIMQLVKMGVGSPFSFPEVWHTVAFMSSLFVFIPAVVVIMFISNEYTFRTHRQNIIDGWSRKQFVTSKLVDVLLVTLIITALYVAICLVTGASSGSTGLINRTWTQAYYIGLFALQTFAQLSFAFLIGFLIRKAFLALGIFLFWYIVLENLIVGFISWKGYTAGDYLPLEISDKLIPKPAFWGKLDPQGYADAVNKVNLHIFLTIGFIALIWFICYRINDRRDLK